jgi:TRAP-type mannitol/chloroaromatic compound transport system permease small subunit
MLLKLEKGINKFMDWIGITAAVLLILLVIVVTFNVFNRYWFQIDGLGVGVEEIAWHMYAAVFMLGIPYALRTGSHVRVDLIFENLEPKTKALIDIFGTLLFLVPFCAVVIWSGSIYLNEAWQLGNHPDAFSDLIRQMITTGVGEQSQDPGGLLNRWIIKGLIPFTFILLLLAAVSFFLNKLNILMNIDKQESQS